MLLTDDEMRELINAAKYQEGFMPFARTLEASILAKLREQEPVAWRKLLCFENGAHEYKFSHTNVLKDGEPLYLNPAPIPEELHKDIGLILKALEARATRDLYLNADQQNTDGGSRAGYECPICRQSDCVGCKTPAARSE